MRSVFLRRRRAIVSATFALVVGFAGSSCGLEEGAGADGDSSSFTMAAEPTGNTMDPWKAQISQYVAQATYDTLTHLDADGNPVPWLATSWEYSDPKTLVMELREGVTFTDGEPFNADAVVANIEYAKTATPSNFAALGFLNVIDTVKAVDESTVQFDLSVPNPDLPYGFSQQAGWMVSPKALKDPASLTFAAAGTGPYLFEADQSTENQTYVFRKNPDYWADGEWERFDDLTVSLISDTTASDNAARSGQIDYKIVQPETEISGWETAVGSPSAFFGLTIFDLEGKIAEPLGDVRVRQAMNYAIDRDVIIKEVLEGYGEVNASTPFSSDSAGYSEELDSTYSYDPEKAKELLAEAGYPNGFKLDVLSNPKWARMAQAVAGYLREIGIDVTLSEHLTDFPEEVTSGKWAVAMGLQGVTGLPYTDVSSSMTPTATYNPLKNKDSTVDSLLAEAVTTTGEKQEQIYGQLASHAAEQAWFVVPALTSQLHGFDPDVVEVVEPKRAGAPALYDLTPAQG